MIKDIENVCNGMAEKIETGVLSGDECMKVLYLMLDAAWQEYENELEVCL